MSRTIWGRASATGDKGEFEFYAAMQVYRLAVECNNVVRNVGVGWLDIAADGIDIAVAQKNTARQKNDHVDLDVIGKQAKAVVKPLDENAPQNLEIVKLGLICQVEPQAVDVKTQESCTLSKGWMKRGTGNLFFEDDLFIPGNEAHYWAHVLPYDRRYETVDILHMPRLTEAEIKEMSIRLVERCRNRNPGYIVPVANILKHPSVIRICKRPCIRNGEHGYLYSFHANAAAEGRDSLGKLGGGEYRVTAAQLDAWRGEWQKAAQPARYT